VAGCAGSARHDEQKPYLETAPYLIVVFAQTHSLNRDGYKVKNYYVMESVGIATGMLMRTMPAFRIFRRSLSKKLRKRILPLMALLGGLHVVANGLR
jgi:hypothetical protein